MNKEEKGWLILSNILIGAGAGVLLAAVLLFLFGRFGFSGSPASRFLIAVVAACLPFVCDVSAARGMNPMAVEGIMIGLSLLICLLYVHTAASNELAVRSMTDAVMLVHLAAFGVQAVRWLAVYIKNRKESA